MKGTNSLETRFAKQVIDIKMKTGNQGFSVKRSNPLETRFAKQVEDIKLKIGNQGFCFVDFYVQFKIRSLLFKLKSTVRYETESLILRGFVLISSNCWTKHALRMVVPLTCQLAGGEKMGGWRRSESSHDNPAVFIKHNVFNRNVS